MAERIRAAEAALDNTRGHVGIVPRDLRRIVERMLYNVITNSSEEIWYMYGEYHRRGGPAYTRVRQSGPLLIYHAYGEIHRDGGHPAIIEIRYSCKECAWRIAGQPARPRDLPTRVIWYFGANADSSHSVLAEWENAPQKRFCRIAHGIEETMRNGISEKLNVETGKVIS